MSEARVLSVNVGPAVQAGPLELTALRKFPVMGRVKVTPDGLEGDDQVDADHAGVYYPVYAYQREDLDGWGQRLDRELHNGAFGENLTLTGVDLAADMALGQFWRVGEVRFEVMGPRVPSPAVAAWMGEPDWIEQFGAARRPGVYLRPITFEGGGGVSAGDDLEILWTPLERVTVGEAWEALLGDRDILARILTIDNRSPNWDALAEHSLV